MLKTLVQLLLTPLPSCLRTPVYRCLGARIHRRARITAFTVLVADRIEMGPEARIGTLTIIYGPATFEMGAYAAIASLCIIHGPAALKLGPRAYVGVGSMIDLHAPVTLGEFTGLGPGCIVTTHGIFWPSTWGCRRRIAAIALGDMVWVAYGCRIGPGVTVASWTLVLPNSTLAQPVVHSATVFDSGVERRSFPLALVRHPVTRAWLAEHIRELVETLYQERLRPRGYSLRAAGEQSVVLEKGRRRVTIHFGEPPETLEGGTRHWCFGYDLSESTLTGREGVEALDFRWLLHTPRPSRLLAAAIAFFGYGWGLRFADSRYRHHFAPPPPMADDEPEKDPPVGPPERP